MSRAVTTLTNALAATVMAVLALAALCGCATAPRLGSIAGTVQTPQGGGSTCANCLTPIRARLHVIPDGSKSYWLVNSGIGRGRFYLAVPAGHYVVKVVRPQACDMKRNVQVTAGKTTPLRLICPNRTG